MRGTGERRTVHLDCGKLCFVSLVSVLTTPVWPKALPRVYYNCVGSCPRPGEIANLGWILETVLCIETSCTFFTYFSTTVHTTENKMKLVGWTCILVICLEGGSSLWLLYPGPLAPSKDLVLCLFCSYFLCSLVFCFARHIYFVGHH